MVSPPHIAERESPATAAPAAGVGAGVGTEALYREHAAFVASYLRHMGAREEDLDDMLQDVFVVAHRKGGYRPGPAAPRTWLATLSFRVFVARGRARARQPVPIEHTEAVTDEGRNAAQQLEDRRALSRVQAALSQLSDRHREVFVLFEIEGVACEEIALATGVSTGTVYSRLHHARKRFEKAYRAIGKRKALSERGGVT